MITNLITFIETKDFLCYWRPDGPYIADIIDKHIKLFEEMLLFRPLYANRPYFIPKEKYPAFYKYRHQGYIDIREFIALLTEVSDLRLEWDTFLDALCDPLLDCDDTSKNREKAINTRIVFAFDSDWNIEDQKEYRGYLFDREPQEKYENHVFGAWHGDADIEYEENWDQYLRNE